MEFTTLFLNDTEYVEEEFALAHKRVKEKIKYVVSGQTVQLNEIGALINGYFVVGVGNDIITAQLNTVKYVYVSFATETKNASLLVSDTQVADFEGTKYVLVMKVMFNPIGSTCFVRDFSQEVIEVKGVVLPNEWATNNGTFYVNVPANVYQAYDYVPEFFPDFQDSFSIDDIERLKTACGKIIKIEATSDGYLYLGGKGAAPTIEVYYMIRERLQW